MLAKAVREPLNQLCCSWVRKPSLERQLYDDHAYISYPTWIGGSILCYGRRKSYFPFHCMVGPDWLMVVIVFILIFLVNGVTLFIVSPLGWIPVLIGAFGAILLLTAYGAVAFTDSGIIYSNQYPKPVSSGVTSASGSHFPPSNKGTAASTTNTTTAVISDQDSSSSQSPLIGQTTPESQDNLADSSTVEQNGRQSTSSNSETDALVPAKSRDSNTGPGQEHEVELTTTSPVIATGFPQTSSNITPAHVVMPTVPSYEQTVHTMECGQCQLQRPYTGRHCHYCEVCIDHLDHHCPW